MNSIQGVVTDKETGKPISAAHVYLSHTTIGTTTDANGEFEFSTNLTGRVTVVFSFIGYKTDTYELNLDSEQSSHHINIELEPILIELNEVEVIGSNKEWQQNYEEFKRHFIGTNRYAKRTVIENPWVLDFEKDDDGNLSASASEPVIITNHALGYRIHIDLIDFNWGLSGFTNFYTFYSLFEELEPVNRAQQREWNQTRERVFKGSSKHFFISLYDDKLSRNRFETVLPGTDARVQVARPDEVELNQFLIRNSKARLKISRNWKPFKLSRPVDILYGRRSNLKEERTRSRLVPLNQSGIFLISENGKLNDPKSIRFDGEWSNKRVANFLPDDIRFDN
ncbi:MAG: carboxypeptidase-like regulatory domain-containing protein [Gracilimonas sp.]|nr:carboxypeptidase-like regulatory domain-containing protein [Gracilimonas sp.]